MSKTICQLLFNIFYLICFYCVSSCQPFKSQFCHLIYLSFFSSCANHLFDEYGFYSFIVKLHRQKDCWSSQETINHLLCIFEKVSLNKESVPGKVKVKVAQLCPTLCSPMDYTVHGILQARILEWVAFPLSRGLSQPKDGTQVSRIAGRFFTS